ncbi:MAG TPA: hypothetical protein DHV28_09380 [Ignavibacteriales bacterium]|nr:MAG: hypothetical protein A2057_01615 [Ignavibacteria bacterium GWA2_35_9]OGU36590.1 MAG: hypothetical protein A2068_09890 [Ignavibacteria bacterium GWB2_35_6b]OGU52589.1 MAG: hypothetical protein A2080_04785 [Ignavibacteria bacterium GWC2_36_12]HCY76118.1 hypothetical protein [Ignavibacteriales bacterium]
MKYIIEDIKHLLSDSISLTKISVKLNSKTFFVGTAFFIAYAFAFIFDQTIRDFFSKIHTNYFDILFNIGHLYGKLYLTIIFFLTLYFTGLIFRNDTIRKNGLRIFEAFIFSGIIVTILKSLIGRWRPYTGNGNLAFTPLNFGSNDHLSLPSGDVAIAFAFSTIAAGFFDNRYWKVLCYLFAVLTLLGRIYHDQHWLSDVILGAFIPTIIGIKLNRLSKNEMSGALSVKETIKIIKEVQL